MPLPVDIVISLTAIFYFCWLTFVVVYMSRSIDTVKKTTKKIEFRDRINPYKEREKILEKGLTGIDEIVAVELQYLTDEQIADMQVEEYRKKGYSREQINKAMYGEL